VATASAGPWRAGLGVAVAHAIIMKRGHAIRIEIGIGSIFDQGGEVRKAGRTVKFRRARLIPAATLSTL
jgi:hypothetical protein